MSLTQIASIDFGPVMANGFNLIFSKAESLDKECSDRLADWFSFILSQTHFEYDWPKIEELLADNDKGSLFLARVFYKCQNLAYHKQIKDKIPESWIEKYLVLEQKPSFKYAGNTDCMDAQIISGKLSSKETGEEIQEALNGGCGTESGPELMGEIFLECVLQKTFRSMEHFKKLHDRYSDQIRSQLTTPEQQILFMLIVA